jgi:hypothetical protein
MPKKRKIVNPYCSVPGCRTKRPHAESPVVRELLDTFSDSADFIRWIECCIFELMASVTDDASKGRVFAYFTRMRQSEELYYRTLYTLFVASDDELPHIFSGKQPNSFLEIWQKVNQVILEGRGTLTTKLLDSDGEESTALEMLHDTAHVSFATIVTCIGIAHAADREQIIEKHLEHWKRLLIYLNHMEMMFKAGKPKLVVQQAVTNLHKPSSAWQTQTK